MMKIHLKRILFFLIPLGAFAGLLLWRFGGYGEASTSYLTAAVKKGDIRITIGATGTLEPEELVDVGAQVAGKILRFGEDRSGKTIDYGSTVEKGMVLAQIDDALFSADVAQSESRLALAKAGLERSEADMAQLKAKLDQAERDWARARKLGPSEALSQAAYDSALSACEVAKANLAVGKAAVSQSKSSVEESSAALVKARQNLDYCTIRSPVDGVIIDRRVNIGQTVVASLSAPSLFLIAKDLRRLQIWIAVNEADIGNIRKEQRVVFTVDAFPGESFEGRVSKIRLNANMTQNVVSYIVEVNTDNPRGKLLPYMSANARFIVDEHRDVLMAPKAALKWASSAYAGAGASSGDIRAGMTAQTAEASRVKTESGNVAVVWVMESEAVRPVNVVAGLSDGMWTEIRSEEIREGTAVVVGERMKTEEKGQSKMVNPFTPKLSGKGMPR